VRPEAHRFVTHPHRTLLGLALPVLGSLVAEPATGLVDTFFVARLGAAPQAALGIGATLLSSIFWVFNFLGIGTQTEVARADGAGLSDRAREQAGLAMALAAGIGVALAAVGWPLAARGVAAMGAHETALEAGTAYLRVRLLGGAAVLVQLAAFGALRGLQDMRTPLAVAVAVNAANAALDPVLIFGAGPVPALGLAGAAWASTASQWAGAAWAAAAVFRRLGRPERLAWREAGRLLAVGRDLFLRTGSLMAFLLLTTAAANHLGAASGAAHQAVRQIWAFTAFGLDAVAIAGQSLVGFFLGAARPDLARRVARVTCAWALAGGLALAAAMETGTSWVRSAFVPEAAAVPFAAAWRWAAWAQPANALAFATDGLHWGSGDYRFLRNVMVAATATGLAGVGLALAVPGASLAHVWAATAAWIGVRGAGGVVRIWPGWGRAPLGPAPPAPTQGVGRVSPDGAGQKGSL